METNEIIICDLLCKKAEAQLLSLPIDENSLFRSLPILEMMKRQQEIANLQILQSRLLPQMPVMFRSHILNKLPKNLALNDNGLSFASPSITPVDGTVFRPDDLNFLRDAAKAMILKGIMQ